MKLNHSGAVALMVVVTLLWSTAGVATRQLERADSFEITFWRSAFAFLALAVILSLWRGRALLGTLRAGGAALWISAGCWAVMFTAFMVALSLTSTANVLVTLALGPLFTALIARMVLRHRLPPRTWAAIALAGAGIGVMYATKLGQGEWLGTLVALCVPVAGAVNWTVLQRSRASAHPVDLAPAALVGALISTLCTWPLAQPLAANAHDIGLLALLGTFQLAVPCLLSVICARVLAAPEAALLALLEVIFGIALAWIGASEVPVPAVLAGGSIVIAALAGNELLGWRERRARGVVALPNLLP